MLLRQLTLKNIRSYKEETITFPEGSILLAGDIGSGKSSILLAIEFALFGTSRPDLPAEMLLRKGATSGTVELTFQLGDQEIIIQRNLKKEKDAAVTKKNAHRAGDSQHQNRTAGRADHALRENQTRSGNPAEIAGGHTTTTFFPAKNARRRKKGTGIFGKRAAALYQTAAGSAFLEYTSY